MRIFILNMLFTFFTAQASPSISVTCDESYGIPHEWTEIPEVSPSPLHSLRVDVLNEEVEDLRILNISWAINIDINTQRTSGSSALPDHSPSPETALLSAEGMNLFLVYCCIFLEAVSGTSLLTNMLTSVTDKKTDVDASPALLIVRLGCLVGLVALVICALTLYKVYGIHTNHPFTDLTKEPMSVLIVYPAENLVFQRAVLAFAEFLQCHGGCKVTIDLWQLSRLAEQGLMRWLSEQVQFADRVIIISPQPKHYHIDPWEHAMPAASHDLFPLVLHMVASHARSPSELAKFWVVHLGKAPKKNGLPVELRSCRDFKLMQDLEKIVRHLHPVQDSKKLLLNLRSRLAYGERVTEKLRNAVQQLEAWRSSQVVESREPAPLVTILKT
uniref:SEFIR domain-containing protein n=1 Tax=Esox lucius TaxID=8010 RepID=A0A3P8ZYA9_ESOLU